MQILPRTKLTCKVGALSRHRHMTGDVAGGPDPWVQVAGHLTLDLVLTGVYIRTIASPRDSSCSSPPYTVQNTYFYCKLSRPPTSRVYASCYRRPHLHIYNSSSTFASYQLHPSRLHHRPRSLCTDRSYDFNTTFHLSLRRIRWSNSCIISECSHF